LKGARMALMILVEGLSGGNEGVVDLNPVKWISINLPFK